MNDLVHLEIRTKDIQKAKNFFEQVLGISFENYDSAIGKYFYIKGLGSNNIKATLVEDKIPDVVLTLSVDSIVETLKNVKKAGGDILLNKTAIPSLGYIAYFKDLDGNIFSLAESNKLA